MVLAAEKDKIGVEVAANPLVKSVREAEQNQEEAVDVDNPLAFYLK